MSPISFIFKCRNAMMANDKIMAIKILKLFIKDRTRYQSNHPEQPASSVLLHILQMPGHDFIFNQYVKFNELYLSEVQHAV